MLEPGHDETPPTDRDPRPPGRYGLEVAVTDAATKLMGADAVTWASLSTEVLAMLVAHFEVDTSFLRHNDHAIGATRLVAEWPPRTKVPTPDPLGVVYFADDPVFALAEHFTEPMVFRPEAATGDYQRRVAAASGVATTSLAAVPLLSGNLTTGILGFVKFGDRHWSPEEINALRAIAALFAQLQARIVAENQLRYLAHHDELTGLYNRRALITHLEDRLRSGAPGPVAALFVDLDRLKAINDSLGHVAGDEFIRVFADRLRTAVHDTDTLARLGGDEFVIVPAAPMTIDTAHALAQRIRAVTGERVGIANESLARTVSFGVALGDPGVDTPAGLLHSADLAMLSAKADGGDAVAVFTPAMARHSELRNDIELHLHEVTTSGQLFLNYLPEFDLRTGEILAIEALVRWRHPHLGLLSPSSFITVAESLNLAGELGRWVLRTACADLQGWRSRGAAHDDTVLRINVSPGELVVDGFVDGVANAIDEFGLTPGALCLEITETMIIRDLSTTLEVLTHLKNLGVSIAVDDFGTGYGVLGHLKVLPVDVLKIDRQFVRDLGQHAGPGDLAIVQSIIALAHAFTLDVVAEGVETTTARDLLLDHGCHRAQGFLLSPPVDPHTMETLLQQHRRPPPRRPPTTHDHESQRGPSGPETLDHRAPPRDE